LLWRRPNPETESAAIDAFASVTLGLNSFAGFTHSVEVWATGS
jgi:hypothetical protein